MLLPRAQLPLSSLDIVSSAKTLGQSRLFETHVKILELEDRMGSQPMVLIARLDDARTLCAVERESRGLYALCQLGSWVNLQKLKVEAVVSKQEMPKHEMRFAGSAVPHEAMPLATTESTKYSKKKRLAIEAIQSMVKRPPPSLVTNYQESPADPEPPSTLQGIEENIVPLPHEEVATQLTAAEIFENVRNQYFEALYLSKVSCMPVNWNHNTKFVGFVGIFCKRTSFTCQGSISP